MKGDIFKFKKTDFLEGGDSSPSSKPSRMSPISNFTTPADIQAPTNNIRSFSAMRASG